jgi:hypothetical protein
MQQKAIEVQSPNAVTIDEEYVNIFLAGSIEMGKAIEWQKEFIAALSDKPIRFLNPRRDDWDSSWGQTIDDPRFVEQVQWELNSMEMSHMIVMVIDPATLSPVTMIELGLHAKEQKLMVVCPDGFWKKGNVDVTCEFYGVNQFDTMEELIDFISKHI